MLGNAWKERQSPAAPVAGAALTLTVPGHTWHRFITIRATFTTDATVANRGPFIAYTDGDGAEWYRAPAPVVIAASSTLTVTWAENLDVNATTSTGFAEAPHTLIKVPSGHHLVVGMSNMDGADQVSGVQLYVERYPTGPMEYAAGADSFDPSVYP